MLEHTIRDGKLTFQVLAVPRASRSEIIGEHNGALRVRIAAPPVDGSANAELIRLLAKRMEVPASAVAIKGGHNSRLKTVCVEGAGKQLLALLL